MRSNKENSKPATGDVYIKKPRTCTLLDGYKPNLKAANNHFQRYSDVKPREERAPTVMDLANQACVLQKVNGWKIFHLNAQMEDLVSVWKCFSVWRSCVRVAQLTRLIVYHVL